MDNLTHSLVGTALSELAVPVGADRRVRRSFFVAGVVASNLPDADIFYASFTSPVGYLLHHRGHTHTLVGALALGLLLAAVLRLVPTLRALAARERRRLWLLIAVGLLGHLCLDAWNTYGVHPFHPFDKHWYYGDAAFIFEPWLAVLLGVAAAWNARGIVGKTATILLTATLLAAAGYVGVVSHGTTTALVVSSVLLARLVRTWAPRRRAAVALAAGCALVACQFGLSRAARAATLAELASSGGGEVRDVILNPDPAAPWCWTAISVQRDERADEYVLRRGTLSLWPAWQPPAGCASHRLVAGSDIGASPDGRVLWRDEIRQSLTSLRELNRTDCWARAWLQFGRVPFVRDGALRDLRFENRLRGNFSSLKLEPHGSDCPAYMTSWAQPRADLLDSAR